jgi:hypothetical protein
MAAAAAASGATAAVRVSHNVSNQTNTVEFTPQRKKDLEDDFLKRRDQNIKEMSKQPIYRRTVWGGMSSKPKKQEIFARAIENASREFFTTHKIQPQALGIDTMKLTQSCFLIPPNFNDPASDHGGLYVSHSSSAG